MQKKIILIITPDRLKVTQLCELIRRTQKDTYSVVHPIHYLDFTEFPTRLSCYNRIKQFIGDWDVIIDNYFNDINSIKQLIFNLNIIGTPITHLIINNSKGFIHINDFDPNMFITDNIFLLDDNYNFTSNLKTYLSNNKLILNINKSILPIIFYNVFESSKVYSKILSQIEFYTKETTYKLERDFFLIKFAKKCYLFELNNKHLYKLSNFETSKLSAFVADDCLVVYKNKDSNLNKLDFIIEKRYTRKKNNIVIKRGLLIETNKIRFV